MKNLFVAALAAIALVCPTPAFADNPFQPVAFVGPTTISAQCTTPATGCAVGQWVTAHLSGHQSIGATLTPAVFTGTLACFFSKDGTNWFQGLIRSGTTDSTGGYVTAAAFSASSTISNIACSSLTAGASDVALVSTAAVTNTASVTLLLADTPPRTLEPLVAAKGAQTPNSTALGTQDLKDAGRSFVVLGADGVTPAIAETVITFSLNKGGTVTGAQTTYAITSGKTLRVQSLACSITAGAAANRVRVALRLNTGGACLAGSGLLMPAMELAPNYGTAAAAEGGAYGAMPIPDGLELTGTNWNICLSESATAASGTLTCTLAGYEY